MLPSCTCSLEGYESACNAGDLSSIPGLGRSPGEGKGYPLQNPSLENSIDYIVHGAQRVGHDRATFTFTFSKDSDILTSDETVAANRPCILHWWIILTQLNVTEARLLWIYRNILERLQLELGISYQGLRHRLPPKLDHLKQNIQVVVVQSLSRVQLFATPWTAACQAPLSSTVSQSLLRYMYIESVMLSNILSSAIPSPFAFNIFQHQNLFQWVCFWH